MAHVKIGAQLDYLFTNYSYLSEATVANFQNNEKIWILCVDKALLSDGKNTVQTKQWLDKCYLDSAPLETTVKRWYANFKCIHTDTNDAECSGCANSTVVPENTKKLHKFVLPNSKLMLHAIAESCVQSGCHVCSLSIIK